MRSLKFLMTLGAFLCAFPAVAADLDVLVPSLKQGGYVIVVRHVATDESQKDVHPFVFDDMRSQRQLSEHGRQVARDMGAAVRALRIPIGIVYTSQLYRAVETGTLISNQAVVPRKPAPAAPRAWQIQVAPIPSSEATFANWRTQRRSWAQTMFSLRTRRTSPTHSARRSVM
jgi:broad specificity phosphatase PhoE